VRTGNADGQQQIFDLLPIGQNVAIGYYLRGLQMQANVTLDGDGPFGDDVALHIVRVDGVAAHADGFGRWDFFRQMVFRHRHRANHPPRFTNLELA